jgi:hypothetical protein
MPLHVQPLKEGRRSGGELDDLPPYHRNEKTAFHLHRHIVRVLLANPRWERSLLRFLEPRAGRVVADGTDEAEAWARRTDDCIAWEGREEVV